MSPATRRLLPAAIAALIFIGISALYVTGRRDISDEILRGWGVDVYKFPFLDTETVMSAVRCLKAGVDVFAGNPCDPLRRTFDYSPLWLLLAKLPVTEAWLVPTGLAVDITFILSLLLLPPGRGTAQTWLIVLGVTSSIVVFAVERGNNDLVLFILAALAAALIAKTPVLRWVGYGAALLAGLLKYYPMTLMLMATRERPSRFLAIAAAGVLVVGLFLWTMGHDLIRALHLIPKGGWFGDMFGSTMLSGGLVARFGWSTGAATALRIALTVTAAGGGIALVLRPRLRNALEQLTEGERMALLAGGLLIVSCYFTAQNIGYRCMHLILTLPALTALVRLKAGRLVLATTVTVLLLLWSQGWRNWIELLIPGRPTAMTLWFVREGLWWWTVSMLIGLVLALLMRSEMGRIVFRGRLEKPAFSTDRAN